MAQSYKTFPAYIGLDWALEEQERSTKGAARAPTQPTLWMKYVPIFQHEIKNCAK